jgi:hypothetical protein
VIQIRAENSANSGEVFGLVPGTVEAHIHTYHMLHLVTEFPAQHFSTLFLKETARSEVLLTLQLSSRRLFKRL